MKNLITFLMMQPSSTSIILINFVFSALICTWSGALTALIWDRKKNLHALTIFFSLSIIGIILNGSLSDAIYFNELLSRIKHTHQPLIDFQIFFKFNYLLNLIILWLIFVFIQKEEKHICDEKECKIFKINNCVNICKNYYLHLKEMFKAETNEGKY